MCVYTNAVCPVMHMSVSCPCVCRRRAGLCVAVTHDPCYLFLLPSDYSLLFSFTGTHCLLLLCRFFSYYPSFVALSLLFSISFLPSSPLPPSSPHTTQLLTGCIYHPKEAQQLQSLSCCMTGCPQTSIPHRCKVCGHGQPRQVLANMPCCRDFHQ